MSSAVNSSTLTCNSQQVYSSLDLRPSIITTARSEIYLSFPFTHYSIDLSTRGQGHPYVSLERRRTFFSAFCVLRLVLMMFCINI
ncbi:hypothetical protein AHAS_Ahas13G0368000 [Arachis hypogaea]